MKNTANFGALLLFASLMVLSSCSKKPQSVQLFYGSCSVEVVSKTKGAQINIDNILVGSDDVKVDIPCGEKEIIVEKEGYMPYREFLPVSRNQPLKVTVSLEKVKDKGDYALSSTLIEQTRKGEPLIDPQGSPEQKERAIKLAELRIAAEKALRAKSGAVSASAGAGAAAVEQGSWDSVEDWR